jgi:hypothetical protein
MSAQPFPCVTFVTSNGLGRPGKLTCNMKRKENGDYQ